MSHSLRGPRADLEAGILPGGGSPVRRGFRMLGGGSLSSRSVPPQSSPAAFLVTVLLLFLVLNSQQVSPSFLIWVGVGVFFMLTSLRMYSLWHQVQAQLGAAVLTSDQVRMSPGLQLWSLYRGPRDALQGLRLQLALLERDFDELDYDALRALDPDNPPDVRAFSEAEVNALPSYPYKKAPPGLSPIPETMPADFSKGGATAQANRPPDSEELTCSVCLENVLEGELVRMLPCLHRFHQGCVDRWLRQQATCPVCKFKLGTIDGPDLI